MPRLPKNSLPKYRFHRPSGRAVVTHSGKVHYLGKYDSEESHDLYDRLIPEWLSSGRVVRPTSHEPDLTISELCNAYRKFAEGYNDKNGQQTSQITIVQGNQESGGYNVMFA